MRFLFTLLMVCVVLNVTAQNKTVAYGEKLVFKASYNMSGIMTDIAQVKMETSKLQTSKSTLMRLKCTATTYSKWDSFFKIRDLYESYVNPNTFTPYLYKRDINEGGYYKFIQYKYNRKARKVKSIKKKKRGDGTIWEENKTVSIGGATKDLVSTLYYVRNLDIHKANPGDQQNFTILFDNKQTVISIRYIKKEIIDTQIGRKECYKLALSVKGSNVLKGQSNLLWLTADANKIPVYAKFKIPVGNGELKIVSANGLKN